VPTAIPSVAPSAVPTSAPTAAPTAVPSVVPSHVPSVGPTAAPSQEPTIQPSVAPTLAPSVVPSAGPSTDPTVSPSAVPTAAPSADPSTIPSLSPTAVPTEGPTAGPTAHPTVSPTVAPTVQPSTASPSVSPTVVPSVAPGKPTAQPTAMAAPPILQVAATVAAQSPKSSVRVAVALQENARGSVYCTAVRARSGVALSPVAQVTTILGAGHRAVPNSAGAAEITLVGLQPSTEYAVYCAAESETGGLTSLEEILSRVVTVRTACCRTVSVLLAASSVYVGSNTPAALKLSVDAVPDRKLTVTLSLSSTADGTAANSFYPDTVVFTNTSSVDAVMSVSLIASVKGTYNVIAAVLAGGNDASQYATVLNSAKVTVVGADGTPTVPQLYSAAFSDDGSYVIVTFSEPTNKAGMTGSFPCTSLLQFPGFAAALCQWRDASTVWVFPSSTALPLVEVGANVSLSGQNQVRAECGRQSPSVCASWETAPAKTVAVAAPSSPKSPVVVLSVPSTISSCAGLAVTLAASQGSGGRSWLRPQFNITTDSGDRLTVVENFLNRNYTFRTPAVIANSLLQGAVGGITITVRLCNFLGACGAASRTVTVNAGSGAVPAVELAGLEQRSVATSAGLLLSSTAYVLSCNGTRSTSNLQYHWAVQKDGVTLSAEEFKSDTNDVTKFRVSAYHLRPSSYYVFTLTVTSKLSGLSSAASVRVTVPQSVLVAQVRGGSVQSVALGSSMTLDASGSYDADQGPSGDDAGLSFTWSCVQTAPAFSAQCPLNETSSGSGGFSAQYTAYPRAAQTQAVITMTVSDATRSSTQSITVNTGAPLAPVVAITSSGDSVTAINTDDKLTLSGTVTTQAACSGGWAVINSDVDLAESALTPPTTTVLAGSVDRVVNLVLKPGVLPVRTSLIFALQCGATVSQIEVTTNGPPLPGAFTVYPEVGVEITTLFALQASSWSDADLPLSYQFGFVSATSDEAMVLQGRSEAATAASRLASGGEERRNEVQCFAQIFDGLSAAAYITTIVTVTPAVDAVSLVSDSLSDTSSSAGDKKNTIALASAVLNRVSCANAPDCAGLSRQNCSQVTDTCGACLAGTAGDVGNSNSPCVAVSGRRRLAGANCTSDADCGSWEMCSAGGLCYVPKKECDRNCSARGSCSAVNVNSLKPVDSCLLDDPTCVAVCSCAEGYGGRTCEVTSEYLAWRQGVRRQFVQSLFDVVATDDVTAESVAAWTGGLSALAQDAYELSNSTVGDVETAANAILDVAGTLPGFGFERASGLLDAINGASAAASQWNRTDVSFLGSISKFNSLMSSQLALEAGSAGYRYSAFRLSSVRQYFNGASAVSLSVPYSSFEQASDLPVSGVSILSSVNDTDTAVALSVISTSSALYGSLGSSLNANPLRVQVSRASGEAVTFTVKVAHNGEALMTPSAHSPEMQFYTNCSGQDSEVYYKVCPVSELQLQHNCTGLQGRLHSQCPVIAPTCGVLNFTADIFDTNSTVCTTLSYDARSTTCECRTPARNITAAAAGLGGRRLADDNDAASESGALDVAAASVYLSSEFTETFYSSDNLLSLDALKKVLIVILMFGTLWGAGIFLIMTCTGRSKLMEPKHKMALKQIEDQLKSKRSTNQSRAEVAHYLTNYVIETFPAVFSNKPFFGRLYGEVRRHHRYLTLFTATESKSGDKQRVLTAIELLSVQTMLLFLLALLYDVQAPTDDGSCPKHFTEGTCLTRKSPFDNSQSYCEWATPGADADMYYCRYNEPDFSLQIVIYIAVLVSLFTAVVQYPIDQIMEVLSAPLEDELKAAKAEPALTAFGRRVSNVARRVSAVAGNALTAARDKLAGRKSVVGAAARTIPDSTGVAHAIASVSMSLIAEASQQSLRERELNQLRQFHSSGGRHMQYGGGRVDDSDSGLDSEEEKSDSDRASVSSGSRGRRSARAAKGRKAGKVRGTELTTVAETALPVVAVAGTAVTGAATVAPDVNDTMQRLLEELSCQRRLLKQHELEDFDRQWGLDPVGEFEQGERSRIPFLQGREGAGVLIRRELGFVRSETAKKVEKLRYATDQHTGLEILHLFIVDLLGRRTPAARIFETKAMEDFKHTRVVSKTMKRLAVLGLVLINAFFVYYAMLTGYRRGASWQRMYLVACLLQFAVEILLFETMECVWINCCIPVLVSSEVRRVGDDIIEVVQQMCAGRQTDPTYFLNAPDFLFVSTNIAKRFPELMESILVRMYHSHLPGEMARIWQVGAVARTNRRERIRRATLLGGILGTLQYLGTAPFVLHRMFVRFSQPFAFSALVLFWQIIVSNQLYAIIAGAIIAAFAFYCVYMYYVDKHINSSIKPLAEVSAEYPDEPSEGQEDNYSAPARDRTISHDGLPLNMPVLDSNFDAVFSRRPFGSKSNNSSDSESYTRLTADSATKTSAGKPAEPVKAAKAPESAAAGKTKSGKSDVSRTGAVGGYASSSALSSEDLPSDLDKPSRRSRAHTARATKSKQRVLLSGRDSRKVFSKQPRRDSSSDRESETERRRRRKKEKKQKGRGRTHSDMSVESIPEGDREEEDSCSSSEEGKARSKSKSKTRREKDRKGMGQAVKKEGKSKHRKHRRGSSSDDSHSSDDARFSHSDSSVDTSSSSGSDGERDREAAKRAIKGSRGNGKEAKV
jgi:hypothetical protein